MTPDQARQFLIKIDQLPEGLKFYCTSELFGKAAKTIGQEFGLTEDVLYDLFSVWVMNDFDLNLLSKEIAQVVTNHEVADLVFLNWLGKIALPLDQYLEQDIAAILQENNINPDNYQSYVNDFILSLEEYSIDKLNDYVTEVEANIDPEEEKQNIYDLMSNHLLDVLSSDSAHALVAFNRGLIYVLNNQPDSRRLIESRLVENNEKLTNQAIIVDGKAVQPTIANWLRDFNNNVDMANFDSLAIADYLVKTNNAKNLNEKEKQLVQSLLQFYYNLKFYPDSMAEKPITEAYIMPIRSELQEILQAEDTANNNEESTVVSAPTTKSLKTVLNKSVSSQEQTTATMLKLQKMAEQYPTGSLERLAIEEEIKKMK